MTVEEIKLAFKKNQETKISLTLIDDIDKVNSTTVASLQRADNAWKEYQNYLTRADAPYKKMLSARESYLNSTTNITGLLNKAVMMAKELGVNPESIKGYSALKQNIKVGNEIIDTIDTFKDPSTFQ
jgi:hypothetical protein